MPLRGEEARKQVEDLNARIGYYQQGLEPGGLFTAKIARDNAEQALRGLQAQLEAIEPGSLEDRWIFTRTGKTYADHWLVGGIDALGKDLLNAGITVTVKRTTEKGKRAPVIELEEDIPTGVEKRLAIKEDAFKSPMQK